MRDIKFRAKRVDNGEWVYGSLFVDDCYDGETECYIEYMNYKTLPYKKSVKVKPETVGQFTELCDKNGKEIYDGDIVKILRGSCFIGYAKEGYLGTVYFNNRICGFELYYSNDDIFDSECISNFRDGYCEVIGNIYDNPELLKGE